MKLEVFACRVCGTPVIVAELPGRRCIPFERDAQGAFVIREGRIALAVPVTGADARPQTPEGEHRAFAAEMLEGAW